MNKQSTQSTGGFPIPPNPNKPADPKPQPFDRKAAGAKDNVVKWGEFVLNV